MAENYISTNMETGVQVKESLTKIESYQPDLFAWTEIGDSVTINLKSPTTYYGITDPGDYVIYKFSNGPSKIPSTLSPILLSLRDGKKYVSANGIIYTLNSAGDTWVNIDEAVEDDTILYVRSDTAPTRTTNTFWFDTSHYDETSNGYIDLKYYDTNSNDWVSVFNDDKYLKKSVLDPDNKNTDIYNYITDKISSVIGNYGEFIKHKANQLTLIHITSDEREQYAKIINENELRTLINDTYKAAISETINTSVDTELDMNNIRTGYTELDNSYKSHLTNHITAENITTWKNKADGNHTHDYTTGDTKLKGSQIVSGIFGEDQLPNDIKERYYQITNSPEAEFSNTSITDVERKAKYHTGNAFYYETTDETTGENIRKWYRIIDSTKIGTSNWANGIIDFTGKDVDMDWSNITGRPTTIEEFGITRELYTKSEVDEKFNAITTQVDSIETAIANCEGDTEYNYSADHLLSLQINRIGIQYKIKELSKFDDTMTGIIPQLDCIIKTTDGKIYKTTYNNNSTYVKPDGSTYTTSDSKEPLGATMLEVILPDNKTADEYFNERFPEDYSTMNVNPNYESSGCGIAVTADNTEKTLIVPDPGDTSKALCTIKYSNSYLKFVYPKAKMIANVMDVGVGSTDKINCLSDTYDTLKPIMVSLGIVNWYSLLSIGSTFNFGKYQVGSEEPWAIEWEIVHQESDYQIAMAKQIIDLRCFDAKESSNSDRNRRSYGNNNWRVSNIEQWLNSDASAGNWYSAQHEYDAPPSIDNIYYNINPYDKKPGFLYYFTDEEKALLQDMTLTLANNTVTDSSGGSYTWTGKVWLPTFTQMGFGQNNNISEGTKFSKFTDDASRIKTIHAMCAANNQYCIDNSKTEGTAWNYRMSSADESFSYYTWDVYYDGTYNLECASEDNIGLTPCIRLPR